MASDPDIISTHFKDNHMEIEHSIATVYEDERILERCNEPDTESVTGFQTNLEIELNSELSIKCEV